VGNYYGPPKDGKAVILSHSGKGDGIIKKPLVRTSIKGLTKRML
jgi:hypothetical protein